MRLLLNRSSAVISTLVFWAIAWGGCTTTEMTPPLPPIPPVYTQVPHPTGTDLSDISALFTDPSAPALNEFVKTCDQDFRKLIGVTPSLQELQLGTRELVRNDPIRYHWCFYAKILKLESDLKEESYVDERQKKVLDTFQFLSPVARAFTTEFRDSRYLRNAVYRYKKLSEWVFFRRLELSPAGTMELVQPSNPFGLWRKSDDGFSILEKYHIANSDHNYTLGQSGGGALVGGQAPLTQVPLAPIPLAPMPVEPIPQTPPSTLSPSPLPPLDAALAPTPVLTSTPLPIPQVASDLDPVPSAPEQVPVSQPVAIPSPLFEPLLEAPSP